MSAEPTDSTRPPAASMNGHAAGDATRPDLGQTDRDQTRQDDTGENATDAHGEVDAGLQAGAGGSDTVGQDDLAALLAQAQAQLAVAQEDLLRAKAETENIRRRATEDVSKARKFGIESFAESLVPVKDSLEAALAQADQSPQAWQEGVQVTLRQLSSAFERHAMKDIAPAPGEKFDPHLHQAISSVASEYAEGCVAQMLQKGYTIAERVLRPALVMVSCGSGQTNPLPDQTSQTS